MNDQILLGNLRLTCCDLYDLFKDNWDWSVIRTLQTNWIPCGIPLYKVRRLYLRCHPDPRTSLDLSPFTMLKTLHVATNATDLLTINSPSLTKLHIECSALTNVTSKLPNSLKKFFIYYYSLPRYQTWQLLNHSKKILTKMCLLFRDAIFNRPGVNIFEVMWKVPNKRDIEKFADFTNLRFISFSAELGLADIYPLTSLPRLEHLEIKCIFLVYFPQPDTTWSAEERESLVFPYLKRAYLYGFPQHVDSMQWFVSSTPKLQLLELDSMLPPSVTQTPPNLMANILSEHPTWTWCAKTRKNTIFSEKPLDDPEMFGARWKNHLLASVALEEKGRIDNSVHPPMVGLQLKRIGAGEDEDTKFKEQWSLEELEDLKAESEKRFWKLHQVTGPTAAL